ncbi:MAG TPA: FAD-binding oxidoreductase [Steroidobacteraceae bacterium]|nr:FAD-binding oxidoreductase [Steroidobacteraceae bacterium]
MKRRSFLAAGAAAVTSALLSGGRARAAAAADLPAIGLDGKALTLKGTDIDELRAALRGELLGAGHAGYDEARRLWNPSFDRHPALIARCAGAADVKRAVSFAAAQGLLTAVRAGGHSFSGQSACDGGLMLDLAPMRAVEVDPIARTARVAGGALLAQLDREAQVFGLATTAGVAADTGVAGLTLGGGIGRLGRRFGLACDNLIGAEVVTADGRWLRASEQENPDLLWALRGGGGNFGVVTEFVFRMHEVGPPVYGGEISYPLEQARTLLRSYADFCAGAPDELYVGADLIADPHGTWLLVFDVTYSGPLEKAAGVVAPLRKLGKPHADSLGVSAYTKLQGSEDAPGHFPQCMYLKGGLVGNMTPEFIDTAVGCIESGRLASTGLGFQPMGGAIGRVMPNATAFWNRAARYSMHIYGLWKSDADPDTAERNKEWVRGAYRKLDPLTQGRYVNIASLEDRNVVTAAYGENYLRLAALKKQYDPGNLFRLNANIKPA